MARQVTLTRPDGRVVCERCSVADRPLRRMRGLLGRRALGGSEGLLLCPAGAVHTFFMRFPIDVVFLDGAGIVVGIERELPPWRTAARRKARSVVELAAGEADRRRLGVGERLEVA